MKRGSRQSIAIALRSRWLLAALFGGFASSAEAQPQALPDVVKLPSGLDLGGSSFYDGFGGTDPGWVFLDFARWNHFTSIRDSNGRSVPLFVDPRIDAYSNLFHIVYVTPLKGPTGAFTVEVLLPVVGFDTEFNPRGSALRDNGLSIGDLTLGVDYQTHPVVFGDGSVLSWRAGLDVTAPTGSFDRTRDLNQGAGFWSIVPYAAVTVLPVPKWEVSARLSYDYNFSTSRAANVPSMPGFAFHDGQAGPAGWINFASSYELFDGVRPGVNGFWLRQLSNDRTNGVDIPHSRVDELYLGPGLSWQVNAKHVVNFNVYLPVSVSNAAAGPEFNVQNVIRF
jgi:hypothetical protein